MSRKASASHRPRPSNACWRHGPGSPAASARIHPVLRRSSPSRPSKNKPAEGATRSCLKEDRIRALPSRKDDAQSSSVASIDAPDIHDLPNHGCPVIQRSSKNATVMLGRNFLYGNAVHLQSGWKIPVGKGAAQNLEHTARDGG